MRTFAMGFLWLAVCSHCAVAQPVIKVGTLEGAKAFEPAIAAVYKEIGLTAEFVLLPPERSLKSVENGEIDADLARVMGGTAGYQNVVETHEPMLELQLLAVVRKDFKATKLTPADLKAYKLGLYRGTKIAEGLVAKLGLEAAAANSAQQMYQMLSNGRFDVALASSAVPPSAFPELAASLKTLDQPLATSKLIHVVNKKWAANVPKIDAAIKAMKADGRWAKLTAGL